MLWMTCTTSTRPRRMTSSAVSGWWSLMEMPTWRILPARLSPAIASHHSSSAAHAGAQTCSGWASMGAGPRLRRLRSHEATTWAAGNTSASGASCRAGHSKFLGGTLVQMHSLSRRARAASPTSRSERPSPYTSAVSIKVTPRSSARASASRETASSAPPHMPPPIAHAPNPTSDTVMPVRPSGR
jgi:hypothetical protein